MPIHQILCQRQTKTGAIRPAGHKWVEKRVRNISRHAWAIVFDLYECNEFVCCGVQYMVGKDSGTYNYISPSGGGLGCVAQ